MELDIWKEISLYLPYNHVAVTKSLLEIYDESWFKSKVLLQYPSCSQNNKWEYLYRKLLQSGNIMKYNIDDNTVESLLTEGIKIAGCDTFGRTDLILTFDGNLFVRDRGTGSTKLVDNNVKDIDESSYIKEYEWYFIDEGGSRLMMKSEQALIMIESTSDHIGVITETNFYHVNLEERYGDNGGYNGDFQINTFLSKNKYVKLVANDYFYLQNEDGTVDEYNQHDNIYKIFNIPLIKKIFSEVAELINGSKLYFNYDFEPDTPIFTNFAIENIDGKLQQTIDYYGQPLILIDNNVCQLKNNKSSLNESYDPNGEVSYSLQLIHRNVKNILGRCGRIHFII